MQPSPYSRSLIATAVLCVTALLPQASNATIVEFETSIGTFEVNLYDNATPQTVANFLNYVQNANYSQSVIHRSVAGFVVQGGGFVTAVDAEVSAITENPAVNNEPVFSNVRGSIAMAKLQSGPDTATSQWFFNLANNANSAADLDNTNGGFTVFGEVTGAGMATVDAVADLPTFNFGGAFAEIPLQNYTVADYDNNVPVTKANFVVITAITVIDTTVDSAGVAGLTPALSTANNGGGGNGGGGGGGGSFGLLALLALSVIGRRRYRITKAA